MNTTAEVEPVMMKPREAEKITSLNRRTLKRYVDAGRIRCVKINSKLNLYRREDILDLVEGNI
jgi:predicted site-specific integrase-resolvase